MVSRTFPDLVQAQVAWDRTYAELAASRPRSIMALRRRLLRLSVRVIFHPVWSTAAVWSTAGLADLRQFARDSNRREERAS